MACACAPRYETKGLANARESFGAPDPSGAFSTLMRLSLCAGVRQLSTQALLAFGELALELGDRSLGGTLTL